MAWGCSYFCLHGAEGRRLALIEPNSLRCIISVMNIRLLELLHNYYRVHWWLLNAYILCSLHMANLACNRGFWTTWTSWWSQSRHTCKQTRVHLDSGRRACPRNARRERRGVQLWPGRDARLSQDTTHSYQEAIQKDLTYPQGRFYKVGGNQRTPRKHAGKIPELGILISNSLYGVVFYSFFCSPAKTKNQVPKCFHINKLIFYLRVHVARSGFNHVKVQTWGRNTEYSKSHFVSRIVLPVHTLIL